MKTNIIELYKEIQIEYESITDINDSSLERIQEQAEFDQKKDNTNTYLVSISLASIVFLIFPFIITKIYIILEVITLNLFALIQNISSSSLIILNISLGSASFSLIMYLLFSPDKILPNSKSVEKLNWINRKQRNFIVVSTISSYLSIGIIIFLVYLNLESTRTFIAEYFKIYLLIPFSIITLLLLMISLVVSIYSFIKSSKKDFNFSQNTRYEITYKLLKVLKTLSKIENIYIFSNSDFKLLITELEDISSLIYNFPSLFYKSSNHKIEEEFKQSSNAFENLITKIMFTQEADMSLVKKQLVDYTNLFLNGDLSLLQKSDLVTPENSKKKAKLFHYILLGIYLTLPIIIVVLLKSVFKIEIDEYAQSLLKILYIIWAFIGIFSNPFILNNDNKEIIRDIIKTITGK